MDRSIRGLPDPVPMPSNGERRRRVRQKLHTPVYASFNGPHSGVVLDLSELLDLHEEGFAVQTGERLETNRAVTLCLDLPETKSYIHGTGQVIWSDDTGRGGIRFSPLPESSRHILQEWLFANLLIACSNHAARTEQLARHEEEKRTGPELATDFQANDFRADDFQANESRTISDASATLSLVKGVRREILRIDDDFGAVLQLITERALSFTGASGAALAFLTDDAMICRARAGEPAPPLGSTVDTKQGLSGECVRTGLPVSCKDIDNDPRVDPQVGRALGIGSLTAVPIVSGVRVVGLLEVLSTCPHAFTEVHIELLEGLVEMIPGIHPDKTERQRPVIRESEILNVPAAVSPTGISESRSSKPNSWDLDSIPAIRDAMKDRQPESPEQLGRHGEGEMLSEQIPEQVLGLAPKTAPTAPSRLLQHLLLGLAMAVVAMVVGYLLGPVVEKRMIEKGAVGSAVSGQRSAAQSSVAQRPADQHLVNQPAQAKALPELRQLAERGDADAQWQIGVRYHNGEGVPQDDVQAVQWYLRAAEQGNVAAQSALGSYYWAGTGAPRDLSKAYMWSEIALAGGDENSKSKLEGLASQMTQSQVSAARQQAEEWIHTHGQQAKSEAH
jgi:hypothetical protein